MHTVRPCVQRGRTVLPCCRLRFIPGQLSDLHTGDLPLLNLPGAQGVAHLQPKAGECHSASPFAGHHGEILWTAIIVLIALHREFCIYRYLGIIARY